MSSPPTPNHHLKQQQVSQETKDFISTLPQEMSFTSKPLYHYQGFWYYKKHLEGVVSSQKHLVARDSDIFLASSPKCGTTWLKALTFALLNRKQHPAVSQNHPLLVSSAHDLVPYLELNLDLDTSKFPDSTESFPSPRLFATHMPYVSLPESIKTNTGCKIVYVSRNPKDVLVSMWHFAAKLGNLWTSSTTMHDAFEYFCRGVTVFGPFWEHVLDYWKQSEENNPKRVLFLKYEDMKEQPALNLRRVAEFLGCPFSAEEEEAGVVHQILNLCSFENLRNMEVNKTGKSTTVGIENNSLFRKGEVGDWKNHLTVEMVDRIDQITQEKFRGCELVL